MFELVARPGWNRESVAAAVNGHHNLPLTAAVVATNVVANIVNNANENNNNNNNNNNQDSTNNNNMNIGNSANSNINMNMVIQVPGRRRSFKQLEKGNITEMSSVLHYLFCPILSQDRDKERNFTSVRRIPDYHRVLGCDCR